MMLCVAVPGMMLHFGQGTASAPLHPLAMQEARGCWETSVRLFSPNHHGCTAIHKLWTAAMGGDVALRQQRSCMAVPVV
jgi:hypothetical protein